MSVPAPRGVHLVIDEGARVDLATTYDGQGDDGVHRYAVQLDDEQAEALLRGRVTLHVDELPGRTAVGVTFAGDGARFPS